MVETWLEQFNDVVRKVWRAVKLHTKYFLQQLPLGKNNCDIYVEFV